MNSRLLLVTSIVALAIGLAYAQEDPATQPNVIHVSDKAALEAAKGKDVIVEGVVESAEWSRTGRVMNIEFEGTDQSRFLAVIFVRSREQLDKAFGGDVGAALTGAKVRLRGTLNEYGGRVEAMKGRPQLIIDRAQQITILEPATTQPG